MPKVLLIDPIPSPLVERLRPLFPASADLDVVPTSSQELVQANSGNIVRIRK